MNSGRVSSSPVTLQPSPYEVRTSCSLCGFGLRLVASNARSLSLRFGIGDLSQPQAGAATVLVDELDARVPRIIDAATVG